MQFIPPEELSNNFEESNDGVVGDFDRSLELL